MVVDGEFDRVLVRPLSPLGQVIFSKFEISTAAHLIIGFTALYFGSNLAGIVWTLNKDHTVSTDRDWWSYDSRRHTSDGNGRCFLDIKKPFPGPYSNFFK